MTERLTPQREAEIAARAAHLYEYVSQHNAEWDELAGEDVPALLAELATVRAERNAFRDQRNTAFATNERLLEEAEELRQARLRAENQTRAMQRDNNQVARGLCAGCHEPREDHTTVPNLTAEEA